MSARRFAIVAWREPGRTTDTRGIIERRDGESDAAVLLASGARRIVAWYTTEADAAIALASWARGSK